MSASRGSQGRKPGKSGRTPQYDTAKYCIGQDPTMPMMQHVDGPAEFLLIVDEPNHKEWDVFVSCVNCGHDKSFRSTWDNTLVVDIELMNMANPDLPQINIGHIITAEDLG